MRISADPDDANYLADHAGIYVSVDGARLRNVITADDVEGFAVCIDPDAIVRSEDRLAIVTHHGEVRIDLPPVLSGDEQFVSV